MATEHGAGEGPDSSRSSTAAQEGDRDGVRRVVRRTYVDTYTLAVRLDRLRGGRAGRGARGLSPGLEGHPQVPRRRAVLHVDVPDHRERRRHPREQAAPPPHRPDRRRRRPDRDRGPRSSPRLAAENVELMDAARGRARRAAPQLRTVVVLKDVYGLSHEAIAEEFGISVTAAKVRLHRGRKRMRDLLYEEAGRHARRSVTRSRSVAGGGRRRRTGRAAGAAAHRVVPALPGRAGPLPPDAPRASSCCAPSTSSPLRGCSRRPSPASAAASERRAVTSTLTRRRIAYAGAVAGAVAAAGTTTAAVLVARPASHAPV